MLSRLLAIPGISYIDNMLQAARDAGCNCFRRPWQGSRPAVAYVVKALAVCGGLETRLAAYAESLSRQGCRVVFVTERNRCQAIRRHYECVHINFHARNFGAALVRKVRSLGIDTVEFQVKSRRFMYGLSLGELNRHCRVGCVIHGDIPSLDMDVLAAMDYRIVISDRLCHIDYVRLGDYRVIPNSVGEQTPVWKYCGQKEALIISRIKGDKYRQISSAVEFCLARGIPFTIAGPHSRGGAARRLRRKYGLHRGVFTRRPISTVEYLNRNAGRYLFVAGVGQVLLEAGALGYPCLLASDSGPDMSTFLTRDNIHGNFGRNLTLAYPGERHRAVRVGEIVVPELHRYDISQYISTQFALSDRVREYKEYARIP